MTGVRVKVLFFGLLRDVTGTGEDILDLPHPGPTLETVFQHYASLHPRLAELRRSIVIAQNQAFADPASLVSDGDEIAFLPPVSGGSSPYTAVIETPEGHFFALTREPIDTRPLIQKLLRGEDGAFVDFQGVVRNNTGGRATRYLDYHCYEPMALRVLAELGADIATRHEIGRIAIVHRLGKMEISEASVAVIVTSPHRRAAFDAALEGIDRLKKTVPIWKKEYFEDGEVWVEGQWDESLPRG